TLGSSAFSRLYSIYPSRSFVCAPPWTTFAVITAPFATKTSVAKICGVWRSMYGPSTTRANLRRTSTRTTIVTILQLLRAVNPPRVLPFLSVLSALLMLIAAVMPFLGCTFFPPRPSATPCGCRLQVLPASDRQRVPRRTVAVAAKTAVLQAATARTVLRHAAALQHLKLDGVQTSPQISAVANSRETSISSSRFCLISISREAKVCRYSSSTCPKSRA
ncbi:unnamed protein product, partial [Durusdinium trenchii]